MAKLTKGEWPFPISQKFVSHVKGHESPFSYYMHARVSKLSTIVSMAN